jgi:hypothetical protein
MELKEFISKVISDITDAVNESTSKSLREVTLTKTNDKRTIEFDVAVSAEEKTTIEGKAGVKVLAFVEAGGNMGSESKNSTVSRITFGVDVDTFTKDERSAQQTMFERNRRNNQINPAI